MLSDLLEPSRSAETAFDGCASTGRVPGAAGPDPDEIDFPFAEGAILEDLETGLRREARPGVRQRYAERFSAAMDEWKSLFRRLEVPHTVVRTDEDPRRALGACSP